MIISTTKTQRAIITILIVLFVIALVAGLTSCAGTPSPQPGQPGVEQPSLPQVSIEDIQRAENLVKSIRWIIPLAGSVVAIFSPEALPNLKTGSGQGKPLNYLTVCSICG